MTQHFKFNETITTKIDNLSHDGRGIAHINGKITFIENALPNEVVVFRYTHKQSKFDEGVATEIISPMPERVTPRCQHFGICGGCSLQHMDSHTQIQFKQQHLLEQLQHFGGIQPKKILPPIIGPVWQYRHKARLGVKYVAKKDKAMVGFREKHSRYLADLDQCEVLSPPVGTMITNLKLLIQSLDARTQIPQIEVAISNSISPDNYSKNSGPVALIFRHLTALSATDLSNMVRFAQENTIDLYLQPGGPDSVHLLWPSEGKNQIYYQFPEFGLELLFHPCDFSQVNPAINQQMIKQAISLLEPKADETILDLFCGFGNFTLPLAKVAKQVVGIEGDSKMVARARSNAQHNQIENAEFFMANLSDEKSYGQWSRRFYNKVLLDPPRSGAQATLPFINQCAPERIVYISCNPATLARDAGILAATFHYQLDKVGVLDMFPHTSHVESMAVFEKV
jgi:23S rRNA (uracil1939-C5)-methyltransferase